MASSASGWSRWATLAGLTLLGLPGRAWSDNSAELDWPEMWTTQIMCPNYLYYSQHPHSPYSTGERKIPFQRPVKRCRTFQSTAVESVIADLHDRLQDPDLARLFENAFPSTLDTTVRWHVPTPDDEIAEEVKEDKGQDEEEAPSEADMSRDKSVWKTPQSFIVTGDIDAEWLRDSAHQLAGYQALAKHDKALAGLIEGAINTQAEFVIRSPYCNAFQPPPPSGLSPSSNGQKDIVFPMYEPSMVFECKWEIDSLASFLSLGNDYYYNTNSFRFLGPRWFIAAETVMSVLEEQSQSTFNETTGVWQENRYRFFRSTESGTETLALSGAGHPLNSSTGLIRSAFRPSDDASIFGFFIPGNAMMAVQLNKTAAILDTFVNQVGAESAPAVAALRRSGRTESYVQSLAAMMRIRSSLITTGIWKHGIVHSAAVGGPVFAFEVDGYGSQVMMDDANVPSLLSLPLLGFTPDTYSTSDVHDGIPAGQGWPGPVGKWYNSDDAGKIYANTRRLILSRRTNPYFLVGKELSAIGGPHVGPTAAWPMSLLVEILTAPRRQEGSDGNAAAGRMDVCDSRSFEHLSTVLKLHAKLGLLHETVDVNNADRYSRSWFAWANSVFAQTVLRLAAECPTGIFKKGSTDSYNIDEAAKKWKPTTTSSTSTSSVAAATSGANKL